MAPKRKPNNKVRRIVYSPKHPLRDKNGYVPESRKIVFDRIGPGWHACHYCGKKIRWVKKVRRTGGTTLLVDHVDRNPLYNSPENLVPACQGCNNLNSKRVVTDDECFITRKNGTRLRAVIMICRRCGKHFKVCKSDIKTGARRGKFCSAKCHHMLD